MVAVPNMANKLPTPVTTTDEYLAAVVQELQKLNALLTPPPIDKPASDTVELKEPAKPKPKRRTRRKAAAKKVV